MFPTKFQVNWLWVKEKKRKIYFQDGHHGGHFGFPISIILATFDLQVTLMRPTKFGVNWAWVQERKWNKEFQDGPIRTISPIFDLHVTLMLPTKFRVNLLLGLGEGAKIEFQDCHHSGHLGFPISTILTMIDLQVTPMLPTEFGVNWPFDWGEEEKNRFSRWRPSWISDRNDFSYFWSTPMLPTKYRVHWPRGVGGVGF